MDAENATGGPAEHAGRRLTRAFVELVETVVHDHDIGEFLQRLCDRTHAALEVDAVGVLVESDTGVLELSTASTHEAGVIDAFEMQRRQGPCFEAYATGEPVVELRLETDGGPGGRSSPSTPGRWASRSPTPSRCGSGRTGSGR